VSISGGTYSGHELDLLLESSRMVVSSSGETRIRNLFWQEIDWIFLVRTAHYHRVIRHAFPDSLFGRSVGYRRVGTTALVSSPSHGQRALPTGGCRLELFRRGHLRTKDSRTQCPIVCFSKPGIGGRKT